MHSQSKNSHPVLAICELLSCLNSSAEVAYELLSCPEPATGAIHELLYCSEPAKEFVSEPLICSDPATEDVYQELSCSEPAQEVVYEAFVCPVIPVMIPQSVNKHPVCCSSPVTAKEAIFALSTQPIMTPETICEHSTLFIMATEAINELCPVNPTIAKESTKAPSVCQCSPNRSDVELSVCFVCFLPMSLDVHFLSFQFQFSQMCLILKYLVNFSQ